MKRSDKKPRVTANVFAACPSEGLKHVKGGGTHWSIAPTDPIGPTAVDDGSSDVAWSWG